MYYNGLREWLKKVDEIGELKILKDAHWDLEIGAAARLSQGKERSDALLFDNIEGYPAGYRILANSLDSIKRQALTLGMPVKDYRPLDFVRACKERLKEIKPIAPRKLKSGPVMENVKTGKEVNVLEFPAPKWHELDGGRYIGTGHLVITRDLDEGWVNLGTYRVMVHDESTLGFYVTSGRHGWMHRQKYFSRGEPCQVAISFGGDPLLLLLSCNEIPYGIGEYDFAGGIKGEPIEVIEGELTGLPLPAGAEMVIEGESHPNEAKAEGPFGEWTGYYGKSVRPEPIIKVKRIMHRNSPILLGRPGRVQQYLKAALVWDQLEKAGVPDVKGVWFMEGGSAYLLLVIAIKQRYAGHARQAALAATGCRAGAYAGRYIIVVDEDIDPTNTRQVLWALATRSDPVRSIEIIKRCWSSPLDPAIPRAEAGLSSRAIIDACKPYEWMDEFPPAITISAALKQRVLSKWGNIL